ncbi:MAG TPA: DUF222 domain-containing protein [Aquihabitans sp.]|nr:DUF222 domain-containing protein [Aquihabitans sp.]
MFGPCGAQGGVSRAALVDRLDTALEVGGDDDGEAVAEALVALQDVMTVLESRRVALVAGLAASGTWGVAGYRSPAAWLVGETGMGRAAAGSIRRVCTDAQPRPVLSEVAAAGRLSHEHVRALVEFRRAPVVEVWDRDEGALVAAACRLTVDGLRLHLARWYEDALAEVARNEPDGDPPKGSDGNRFRLCGGFGGRGLFDGELTPSARAAVQARLDAGYERLLKAGALDGDPRSLEEVYGDLFVELFETGPDGAAVVPHVAAVVDLDTLLARAGVAPPEARTARRAEIVGVGPVSDEVIAELCERAKVSLLVTDRGCALWLGRGQRLATPAQRAAAIAVSGGVCSYPGCTLGAERCQIDHLLGWEDGGRTDQPNLAPLCRFHNRLKHRRRIRARRADDGSIEWTAPHGTPITTRWLHQLPPGWVPDDEGPAP